MRHNESKLEERGIRVLARLGLTPTQAKIYLTLCKTGQSTIKTVSQIADIDRANTYKAIVRLEELCLVERIVNVPRSFQAISISDAFSILLNRMEKNRKNTMDEADKLLKQLSLTEEQLPEEHHIILVPEIQCAKRIEQIFETTQKSLDWMTVDFTLPIIIEHLFQVFSRALKRGVKIRIINRYQDKTYTLSKTTKSLINHPNFELRFILGTSLHAFSISDQEEGIISVLKEPYIIHPENVGSWKNCPVLVTNHPHILAILQESFDANWNLALESIPKSRKTSTKRSESEFEAATKPAQTL